MTSRPYLGTPITENGQKMTLEGRNYQNDLEYYLLTSHKYQFFKNSCNLEKYRIKEIIVQREKVWQVGDQDPPVKRRHNTQVSGTLSF